MNPGMDALMERLAAERRRLEQLRSDYAKITDSRFHALRMLWFSVKALFGRESPEDRYAVWSPGIAPGTGISLHVELAPEYPLDLREQFLVDRWMAQVAPTASLETPLVSVVIPAYNHRDLTVQCLRSLLEVWPYTFRTQVILVDDGSSEAVSDLISRMPGIDYIRSSRNEGFIRACNLGAKMSRGKYVLFLNNDATLCGGAIERLVETAERDSSVGIVGAKLLYPDGRLQEAGSIVWRDGTGWNYGRFDDPGDARYNYVRDVDYVSGAALLVRRELFLELGGFDDALQRAYYEDTDLCFGARKAGQRVVYQPLAEVIHAEAASSENATTGMKRYQELNRPTFREKWSSDLQSHFENSPSNVPAGARRLRGGPLVLIIDEHVPLYDRDSGSNRLMSIIRILRGFGYHVAFLPDNYAGLQPYTEELQQLGVEVLYHTDGGRPMEAALAEVLPFVDYAWISRPQTYEKYAPLVRRNERTKVVYDTVDLYFLRKKREAEVLGSDDASWQDWQRMELDAARTADAAVVVTEDEKAVLEQLGISNVFVIPNVHVMEVQATRSPRGTAGLLFIGNYNHPPNVDACTWLVNEIMPLVWERLPKVVLTLTGANPPESILEMESERVRVCGYVPDVAPQFMQSRVFIAPLRYGAGLKGKIGQALSYRLPVVTTPIGAEGFGFKSGEHFVVAQAEPRAFADAILNLYEDEALWRRLSDASAAALRDLTPDVVAPRIDAMLRQLRSGSGSAERVAGGA